MASQLTRLQAVNAILGAAGKMPVNQIEPTTTPSALAAVNIIDDVHREVLMEGWDFNREYEVTVEMTVGTGFLELPTSFLRFDVPDKGWLQVRGGRIYDRIERSFVFTAAEEGTALLYLEWDDLPEECKTYITKRASRRYYEQFVGSSDSIRSLYQDELDARKLLLDMDLENGTFSIFDAPDIYLPSGSTYMPPAPRGGNNPLTNRTPK